MGFAKGIRKSGGGILHNREGVIESYIFTTDTPWTQKKGNENLLYFVPTIKEDGAEEGVSQTIFMGSTDYYEVSDDGQTVTSIDENGDERDKTTVSAEVGAGLFMASLVEAGFPEDRLPDLDGGAPLNLSAIVGARFRFEQRVNEKLTKEKGKRKAKNGKEYAFTDLVVAEVLSLPAAKGGKVAKGGKAPAASAPDESDVPEISETAVNAVLARDKEITLKKLKMAVLGQVGVKHPLRNAIVEFVSDADNIKAMDGVDYNAKTGIVSLAA